MESIKSASKTAIHQIEKSFNQTALSEIKNTVINATWNDTLLPKTKHLNKISSVINSSFNKNSPLSRNRFAIEEILSILSYQTISIKWKVVYKTLVLLLELSTDKHCSDLIFLVLNYRSTILENDWQPKSRSYAYEERKESINSILRYMRQRASNFKKYSTTFINFENNLEMFNHVQKNLVNRKVPGFIEDNLKALELLSEIKFPSEEFSTTFCALSKRLIYDEAFFMLKNIGVLVENKINSGEGMEFGAEYKSVMEFCVVVCEKVLKWIEYIDVEKNNDESFGRIVEKLKKIAASIGCSEVGKSKNEVIISRNVLKEDSMAEKNSEIFGNAFDGSFGKEIEEKKDEVKKDGFDSVFDDLAF